jgi:hypothetical protein
MARRGQDGTYTPENPADVASIGDERWNVLDHQMRQAHPDLGDAWTNQSGSTDPNRN